MDNKNYNISPSRKDSKGQIKVISGDRALRIRPKINNNTDELEFLRNRVKELEYEVARLKKELAERPSVSGEVNSFKTVTFSSLLNEQVQKTDSEDKKAIFKRIIAENKALREE